MYTYKKICITHRGLVKGDYLERIEMIAKSGVDIIILREKDLKEEEYEVLAKEVVNICKQYQTLCMLHMFYEVAKRLGHPYIHLPMPIFLSMADEDKAFFKRIGVSTHSVEEAKQAQNLGADYITASHIFPTKCKEGLAPRGLEYLHEVIETVDIEVYALGGIHPNNIESCLLAGAHGICMMSEYMNGDL